MPYSQGNEESVILDYFKDKSGCFLDLGGNDGITLSNTYALALKGWKGLLVDPSSAAIAKANKNHFYHKDVHCFNCAVADFNGRSVLHESGSHLSKDDSSLLSSLSEKEIQKWKGSTSFTEREVDVVDFSTLMRLSPYAKFQMITVDCEGFDLLIVKQMNLTDLECELICVEWNSKPDVLREIKEHCAKYGLTKELLRNGENVILGKP